MQPGKFADRARAGADRAHGRRAARCASRLEAVLVGGAQMFGAAGSRLDIGARNERPPRSALTRAGVRIVAAETGGTTAAPSASTSARAR